jgi:hypothetical protein
MTRQLPAAARAAAIAAVLAVAAAGCTPRSAGPASHPAAARTVTACPAASPGPALPVAPAALAAAARTASRFTAAYYTWPAARSPRTWLARLRPLATAQLAARLAQATATLTAGGQSSSAAVTGYSVRLVAAGMVIVAVQARQDTAGTATGVSLAVTLVPAGAGWAVYDAEPASAGDSGGPGAAP